MIQPKVPVKNKWEADSSNGSLSSSRGLVLLNSKYRPFRMQIVAWNVIKTSLHRNRPIVFHKAVEIVGGNRPPNGH
jgi:hypothetical protein